MPIVGCNAQPSGRVVNDPLAFKPAPEFTPETGFAENNPNTTATVAAAAVVAPPDFQPSANLNDIIKLARAGVSQDLMSRFVSNTGGAFGLGAKEIIYLNDLGVSDAVINAMMQHDRETAVIAQPAPEPQPVAEVVEPAPVEQPVVVVQEPAPVTVNYFYETLSPYGSWVELDGYGRCWQPTIVVQQGNWQPYCDRGHWVYSNCGWYWASDYSWGGVAFHYGRWFRHPSRGWCWSPDTTWSPAWVSWRQSDDYCGWAPLPPRACYTPGFGFSYRDRNVGISFDFGLGADCFTFVSRQNFCDPGWRHHAVAGAQVTQVFNNTTVYNNYDGGHNTTIFNGGVAPQPPQHHNHDTAESNFKARGQMWTNINNGYSHRQPNNSVTRSQDSSSAQTAHANPAPVVAPAAVRPQNVVAPERPHFQSPVVTRPSPNVLPAPNTLPTLRPGFAKPDNSAPRRPFYQPAPTATPTATPMPTRPQNVNIPEQPHFQSPVVARPAPTYTAQNDTPRIHPGFSKPDNSAPRQQPTFTPPSRVFNQPAPATVPVPVVAPAPARPQTVAVAERPHFQSPVVARPAPVAQPNPTPQDFRAATQQAISRMLSQPAPQPQNPTRQDPSWWTKRNSNRTN